jgi:hypothetical protein
VLLVLGVNQVQASFVVRHATTTTTTTLQYVVCYGGMDRFREVSK